MKAIVQFLLCRGRWMLKMESSNMEMVDTFYERMVKGVAAMQWLQQDRERESASENSGNVKRLVKSFDKAIGGRFVRAVRRQRQRFRL